MSPWPPDIHPINIIAATIFHHLLYHHNDPPAKIIQQYFYTCILQPKNELHFTTLTNYDGGTVNINCLIIAYHKQKK